MSGSCWDVAEPPVVGEKTSEDDADDGAATTEEDDPLTRLQRGAAARIRGSQAQPMRFWRCHGVDGRVGVGDTAGDDGLGGDHTVCGEVATGKTQCAGFPSASTLDTGASYLSPPTRRHVPSPPGKDETYKSMLITDRVHELTFSTPTILPASSSPSPPPPSPSQLSPSTHDAKSFQPLIWESHPRIRHHHVVVCDLRPIPCAPPPQVSTLNKGLHSSKPMPPPALQPIP
jgi:hypothetical protein